MALKWAIAVIGAAAAAGVAVWVLRAAAPEPGIPAEGAAIAEVTLPAELSTGAQIGRNAFAAKCAECHGKDAEGRQGLAPPLIHIYYEPGHHGDTAIVRAVRMGVKQHHWPFGDMPAVQGLTDADIATIVAYVREVQRANGID
jgi:mono/diheme cytochrome c family protein